MQTLAFVILEYIHTTVARNLLRSTNGLTAQHNVDQAGGASSSVFVGPLPLTLPYSGISRSISRGV